MTDIDEAIAGNLRLLTAATAVLTKITTEFNNDRARVFGLAIPVREMTDAAAVITSCASALAALYEAARASHDFEAARRAAHEQKQPAKAVQG